MGSASEKQRSRIQIKKGPNGQEYEYEYVYYYYDDDDDPKDKVINYLSIFLIMNINYLIKGVQLARRPCQKQHFPKRQTPRKTHSGSQRGAAVARQIQKPTAGRRRRRARGTVTGQHEVRIGGVLNVILMYC